MVKIPTEINRTLQCLEIPESLKLSLKSTKDNREGMTQKVIRLRPQCGLRSKWVNKEKFSKFSQVPSVVAGSRRAHR